jgi:hypothetical protein
MKTILKALFLLAALSSALPVFAQSAFETIKARAEAGDAEAQAELGFIYGSGEGVTINIQESLRWFLLAAEQGNARAQHNLGVFYNAGMGVPQDDQQAFNWFKLAAEQGRADSQNNLGFMYGNGKGVVQNYQEAAKWYQLAAEQGLAEAQYTLGLYYKNFDGRGSAQHHEVLRWITLAAEQGLVEAQHALGSMYKDGTGVAQNNHEACKWFVLAAEHEPVRADIIRCRALETVRDYFIDGLEVTHSQKQFSDCAEGGDFSISIDGDIGPDSSFALEELLKGSPNCIDHEGALVSRTTVTLSSAGGLIEDGYKMGQLFRANGVHTKINDNLLCASSCAVAYLGGVDRTMSEDAVIMFHSPYFLELNARGERVPNCDVGSESSAKLLSYYQEMTGDVVGQRLMDRTLSYCSADDGWVLRGANAAELFGVATKI